MDQDQTAPGSTLFVYKALNILVDDKKTYILRSCALKLRGPKSL